MDNYKSLKLKIWVEDENGRIQVSSVMSGGLPFYNQPPGTLQLDWTGNSREIDMKILIQAVACLLKARYGDQYMELLPIEASKLKKELGI